MPDETIARSEPPRQGRKNLSWKLRFEVLKRDRFTCQYCGARPPSATLQIDHVKPLAAGGDNSILNLRTACSDCNSGKGVTLVDEDKAKTDIAFSEWRRKKSGLVGKFFHTFDLKSEQRPAVWQGRIAEQVTDTLYLAEQMSWGDGLPYQMVLLDLSAMITPINGQSLIVFYDTCEEMTTRFRYWLQHRKSDLEAKPGKNEPLRVYTLDEMMGKPNGAEPDHG